jgi:hypothetical protein
MTKSQIISFKSWMLKKMRLDETSLIGTIMEEVMLAQGQTQGSTLQQHTKKTLTINPFNNTCEVDEVSLEVEAGTQVSTT